MSPDDKGVTVADAEAGAIPSSIKAMYAIYPIPTKTATIPNKKMALFIIAVKGNGEKR